MSSNAGGSANSSGWMSGAMASARKGLGRGLAFVGAGAVVGTLALAAVRYQAARADRLLPPEYVLEVPLERMTLVDAAATSPLALLQGNVQQLELPKVTAALRRAAADERCRGVITYVGERERLGGLASVQELRDAVGAFRLATAARAASTAAFAHAYGEAGAAGMVPYYLATASERVYVQPSGMLGLTGLEARAFFARPLLERLRVEAHVFAREEYKSAANIIRESAFTDAQRENLASLIGDMAGQMLSAMAPARGVSEDALREALEAGPLLPGAAVRRGLLNGTKYRDEVQALFRISEAALQKEKDKAGKAHKRRQDDRRVPRVSVERYIALMALEEAARASRGRWLAGTPFQGLGDLLTGRLKDTVASERSPVGPPEARAAAAGQPKVAVVTAVGTIVQGPVPRPGASQQVIDATQLSRQLQQLLEDPDVRAVVLRVNSPGGSALASDSLHHELCRLRAAGKKVVVSMGDVAASGGYYIAAAADRVFAMPGTVTGSIGVVAGKINVGRTLEDVGVRTDAVTVGRNAGLLSPFTGLTGDQAAQVEALVDHVYDDFLEKVSRSRGRPVAEIRQLAKGRVYTGRQAYDVGLVDELGGLSAAVRYAKAAAGLPEDAAVVEHPVRRVPLLLQLLLRGQEGGGGGTWAAAAAAAAGEVGVVAGALAALAAAAVAGVGAAGVGGAGGAAAVAAAEGAGGGAAASVVRPLAEVGASLGSLDGHVHMYSHEAALLARL